MKKMKILLASRTKSLSFGKGFRVRSKTHTILLLLIAFIITPVSAQESQLSAASELVYFTIIEANDSTVFVRTVSLQYLVTAGGTIFVIETEDASGANYYECNKDIFRKNIHIGNDASDCPPSHSLERNIFHEMCVKCQKPHQPNTTEKEEQNIEKKVISLHWIDADTGEIIEKIVPGQKARLLFITQGHEKGDELKARIEWKSGGTFEDGSTELIFSGIVNENGKAVSNEMYIDKRN